jgi:hypothetical protein
MNVQSLSLFEQQLHVHVVAEGPTGEARAEGRPASGT